MDTVFVDDGLGRLLDLGIGGEAKIVLRCEIDALVAPADLVPRGTFRERRLLGRLRVRPQSMLPPGFLPVKEWLNAGQEIRPDELAKIAHAHSQGLLGISWQNGLAGHLTSLLTAATTGVLCLGLLMTFREKNSSKDNSDLI